MKDVKININYKSPCPCGKCIPCNMLGTSWHKNLGFNSPNACTEALYKQGHRYISDWACMWCTGNTYTFTHYPRCDQCTTEEE
jgi:hypothetical protein